MATISNYSEETGYVDILGNDVKVFVCEKTGMLFIPIEEVRKVGFKLFRKNQYNRLLIDDSQFLKEFQLYMLGAAQSYFLEKQIKVSELDIVESINKCKEMLMGAGDASTIPRSPREASTILRSPRPIPQDNFIQNHRITFDDSITVTATNVSEPSQSISKPGGFSQFRSPAYAAGCGDKSRNMGQQQQKVWDDNVNLELRKPRTLDHNHSDSGSSNSFSRENKDQTQSPTNKEERWSVPRPAFSNTLRENGNASRQSNGLNFYSQDQRRPRESGGPRNFNACQDKQKNGFESEPMLEKLKHIELTKPEHKVLVTFIEKETPPSAAWVQDVDNADVMMDIDAKVKVEGAKPDKYTKYCLNKIFLGQHEDSWYRCKIIKFKPLTVFFVDFGNTSEVKTVKEASEELGKIPCQAIKITSHSTHKLEAFENLNVTVKSRMPNGTYVVDLEPASEESSPSPTPVPTTAPSPPKTPVFFAKPQSLLQLRNGAKVMLVGHVGANLALRSRESYEKLKQIEMDLEHLEAKPVESVEKGQLVLCKRGKSQRVVVLDVQGKTVEIEFIDYFEKMKVDLFSLRHITEALASEGPTFIRTPEIKGYREECEGIIKEFIDSKAKLTVVLNDDGFDLKAGEELLSEKFAPREQYPDRAMLAKFEFFQPKLGTATYTLQTFRDINDVTFMDADLLDDHLQYIILEEEPEDVPYEGVEGEVCHGLYQASWFRCVIQRVMTTRYEVRFLDFGNVEVLNAGQLRKFTGNVEGATVLGIPCVLTGLPPVRNIEQLIRSTISEGEAYEIKIKKYNLCKRAYEIEMPSVYEQIEDCA